MSTRSATEIQLSRYSRGSFAEFSVITLPLVLTSLSRGVMFLVDRLVLANHSMDAVNALTAGSTALAMISLGLYGIVTISQVFAAQYHGAKQYAQVAKPVWQMIWFCVLANLISLPLGTVWPDFVLAPLVREQGQYYLAWGMYALFFQGLIYALNSFFTAIGRTSIVTYGAIFANVVNAVLSIMLCLGVKGYIPALGVKGAILSTIIADMLEGVLLGAIFLQKRYRITFNTGNWRFDYKAFMECVRVGAPASLSHVVELAAWSAVAYKIASLGFVHMSTFSVFHALFVFLAHIISGIERGVSSLVANALGAQKYDIVYKVIRSGWLFNTLSIALFFAPILLMTDWFISLLLCESMDPILYATIAAAIKSTLMLTLLYALIDGFGWILAGALTAAGDTRFLLLANSTVVWLFGVLPIYVITAYWGIEPQYTWISQSGFVVMNLIVMALRFRANHWKSGNLVRGNSV